MLLSALLTFSILSSILAVTPNNFQQEEIQSVMETTLQAAPSGGENRMFTPEMGKSFWVDQDNNGIADSLDQEIADRIANSML